MPNYAKLTLKVPLELDREKDGRHIVAVVGMPGVMVYGRTQQQALIKALLLLCDVVADHIVNPWRLLLQTCLYLSLICFDPVMQKSKCPMPALIKRKPQNIIPARRALVMCANCRLLHRINASVEICGQGKKSPSRIKIYWVGGYPADRIAQNYGAR